MVSPIQTRILPTLNSLESIGPAGARRGRARSVYDRYLPNVPETMVLSSPAFADGQPIPARFTADGENISPPLAWKLTPAGTRSLAMIVEDVDAPMPRPFVHWLTYNILPDETALPEAIGPLPQVRAYGLVQGRNSFLRLGYIGCAPPKGRRPHHYHFQLFALDCVLPLNPGKGRSSVIRSMAGHVLAKCRMVGTYQR
ncbi:MAG TPA: YbhB/YbcL family Raf kinase inhibitor-like protein [Tepidisphaeraceae bacterium]|jgi:hypothetical protein|nr:YbhB/YbcL family Raf kinase inhibitor-like protein [Tepidisphaeraceae bacterium]